MTIDQLKAALLRDKAMPVRNALRTADGQVLLAVMQGLVTELRAAIRPAPGLPVDPYQMAMAEGGQLVLDRLLMYRDAAERTVNETLSDGT